MNRKAFLLAAAFLAAPAISFGQDADVVKDAVDPYNAGSERSRFLAAAGVDSELSEEEFKKNLDASDPFVRKFDTWATLRAFDANRNGTIDWFEADGYRKALRDAVLLTYDKDKDGRLDEAERELASKDLAAGKVPRVSPPRRERPTTPGSPDAPAPGTPGANRPGQGQGQPGQPGQGRGGLTEEQRAEMLRRFDRDGDGELSGEERQAARAAQIEEWRKANPEAAARFDERRAEEEQRRKDFVEKYDKNGDGELDEEERRAAFAAERDARMAQWKERDPEGYARFEKQREEFIKRFDKNQDGEVDADERREAFATLRDEARDTMQKLIEKYDTNKDGRLSREEMQAIPESERPQFPGFGGQGGPGGRGQSGPGGEGGRGQGGQRPAGDL